MVKIYEFPTEGSLAKSLDDFTFYLHGKDYSPDTMKAYINGMRCFYSHGFTDVSYDNAILFRNMLKQEGKSAKTINLMLCSVNHYLRWTGQNTVKVVKENDSPFADNGMELEDFHHLVECLLRDRKYHWYVVVKLLASTGMRIGEAMSVTYGDFRKGYCTVFGKGDKERTVYFSHLLRETLFMYIKDKADTEHMIPYSKNYVRTAFRNIKRRYKLDFNNSPHEFRRFFARQMYETTHDEALIKGLLGHENIKTTSHYIKKTRRRAFEMYAYAQNW